MSKERFWLVWNPDRECPLEYRYDSLEVAKTDAMQLAVETGKEYYVLEAKGKAKAEISTAWHELEPASRLNDIELPFVPVFVVGE